MTLSKSKTGEENKLQQELNLPSDFLSNKKVIRDLTDEEQSWIENTVEYSTDDELIEESGFKKVNQ